MTDDNVVQKIWNLCNILRGDGISYHQYVSELTYLLFLKMSDENQQNEDNLLPAGYRWKDLFEYRGDNILFFYQEMLTHLGGSSPNPVVRQIFAFPTTVFSHSENLRAVVDGIGKIDWGSVSSDRMGEIYEGLLAKSSQDSRSGAGQYFTPRALVECMVELSRPKTGEIIQDPAAGSGGFLIAADQYVRRTNKEATYFANPPTYEGVEIEKSTYRICLMNAYLHGLNSMIVHGDALTEDYLPLSKADLILANPPFGSKGGSARARRKDIDFSGANKQIAFLQHIYLSLKPKGRAAVVLPDNVLFEEGIGRRVRTELMEKCNLHTILRLPTGIFYSAGVKTNVLFFVRGESDVGNTHRLAIYDMRTGSPRFGKTRQLHRYDFKEFEDNFGVLPKAGRSEDSRWRVFSRQEIRDRDDNLNISWLKEQEPPVDGLPSITEITLGLIENLRYAVSEVEDLAEELASMNGRDRT